MIQISNNGIITMNRGDYAEIPLFINQGNQFYPIRYSMAKDPSTTITFAIMLPNQSFETAMVRKTYSVNSKHTNQRDLIIQLVPEDTINLMPGKYFYSIKINMLQHGHYCQKTLIPEKMFFIKE